MKSTFEVDSRAALVVQARLRLFMVLGAVTIGFSLGAAFGVLTRWEMLVGVLHLSYAVTAYVFLRSAKTRPPVISLVATAVLDAFMVFAWELVTGKYAILFTPLYNFATIGYGLRTGRREILLISQAASLVFVCLVPVLAPYWQDHMVAWGSAILAVVIVPWYAGELTRQVHAAIHFAELESRAKSELMARVSHELRTPLGGILNAAELIESEASTIRARQLARTIRNLGAHLLADINDLIDQSRFSLGKMALNLEPKTIESQIQVVRASLENRAHAKGLMLQCTVDPRLTQAVLVDSRWLSRALINFAGNAVKFTDVGSVTVHAVLLTENDRYYTVRFSVQDTGIGISEDNLEKIFNPFVQVHGRVNSEEGSGLGLAISKQAVELMGGSLRVNSTLGSGSHFWFDLRLEKAHALDADTQIGAAAEETAEVEQRPARALRVFLVDDNATNLFLLKELIARDGHTVVTASSGEVALAILAGDEPFDLLILDYNLGDMDGAQVLQTYRFGRSAPAPTWFLTADATLVTEQKLRDTGALGVLTKPISVEELRRALAQAAAAAATGSGGAQVKVPSPQQRPGGAVAAGAAAAHLRPVSVIYIDQTVIGRLRTIGRSKDFLADMLKRARSDMSRSIDGICAALAEGSMQDVRAGAHALKGVGNEIGAVRLATLAQALMRANDDTLQSTHARIVGDLRETAAATFAAIDEIVRTEERAASGF